MKLQRISKLLSHFITSSGAIASCAALAACSKVSFDSSLSEKDHILEACAAPAASTNPLRFTSPEPNQTVSPNLLLKGTCSGTAAIEVTGGGIPSGVTIPCSDGVFSKTVRLTDGDGFKDLAISQAGIVKKDYRCLTMDGTPPKVSFSNTTLEIIGNPVPVVSGTCESGIPVVITQPGSSNSVTLDCNNGQFSGPVPLTSGDGKKDLIATQTDPVGNQGTAGKNYLVDTIAPIIKITLPVAGTVIGSQVTVTGICEKDLQVTFGGSAIDSSATGTSCADGTFTATLPVNNIDGALTIIAQQVDLAGNRGSDQRDVLRDLTAPAIKITGPAINTPAKSGVTVTGTCESGINVVVSGAGSSTSQTVPCTNGSFTLPLTFTNVDGAKNVVASQTDASGNLGSDNRDFTRDTTPPAVTIQSPAAGTYVSSTITLSGTCETNASAVQISGSGVTVTTSATCANNSYSTTVTLTAGDGTKQIIAQQTDAAGNVGSDTRSYLRDTTAPVIRITSPANGTQVKTEVTVTGTCENNLAVTFSGSAVMGGTPSALCLNSAFTATLIVNNVDGTLTIVAQQVDAAGNRGSDQRDVVRDTAAPGIKITGPAADTPSKTGVTLIGTCETGFNVVVSGSGSIGNQTVTCTSGNFSAPVTFTNGDGPKNFIATQTDAAGNTASDNRNLVRDTTPPIVTIQSPAADTYVAATINLTGSCETNASAVQISGSGLAGTTNVTCTNGTYAATVTLSSGDGSKQIFAQQTDAAGNSGSDSRNYLRDTTAPVIKITGPAAGSTATTSVALVGTCETGLTVSIVGDGAQGASTTSCTNGQFSANVPLSSTDGVKSISVSQTDAAGNTGTDSRSFKRDTTAPIITIASPASGSLVKQVSVVVSGSCETNLTVSLSGDLATNVTTSCSGGSYSVSATLTSPEGAKTIIANHTDSSGNTGTAQTNFTFQTGTALAETFTTDQMNGKVDILFIDDNSASMDPEQQALGSKFPAFTSSLTGLDWQMGITTTDCSTGPWGICGSLLQMAGTQSFILNNQVPNYEKVFLNTVVRPETVNCVASGACPSGNEEGLKATIAAVDKRLTNNAGFFRDDSALAVVILTDEDEQSNAPPTATTPQAVVDHLRSVFGTQKQIRSYAITTLIGDTQCLKMQQDQQGGIGAYGTYPIGLANLTGGISVSICAPDFSVTLQQIGSDLLKLTNSVMLTNTPVAGSVNVTLTPQQSVTWRVSGKNIIFSSPLQPGTKIDVTYRY
jgi:hypothetical protein